VSFTSGGAVLCAQRQLRDSSGIDARTSEAEA